MASQLLTRPQLALSTWALLALFRHGCMTRHHLALVVRSHPDAVRRSLSRLEKQGFAKGVGVGSHPTVSLWIATIPGGMAASKLLGVEADRRLLQRAERLASQIGAHELGTAELLVLFVRASEPPRRGLIEWQAPWLAARPFRKEVPGSHLVRFELSPDAAGECLLAGGVVRFFVETDTGTEDLGQVAEKGTRYIRALRARRREAPWAVLVACPTVRRAANVAEAVGSALEPGDEDVAQFLVAAKPVLAERGPFASGVWEDAQTGERVRLEDLAGWPRERDYSLEEGDFVGFPPRDRVARDESGRFAPRRAGERRE
ncbi:MAG: replication-relaxation family protein [Actinomycetota bacterium]